MLHLPFSPLFPHKNRFFKASPHPFSTFLSNLFRFSISFHLICISIYFIFPYIFHLSLLPFPLFLLFPLSSLSLSYLPPSISLLFIFFSLFHLISLFSLLTSFSYLSPITIISLLLSFLHYLISFLSLSLYISISLILFIYSLSFFLIPFTMS